MPPPVGASREDRSYGVRSATTWFTAVPAFSDDIDLDDDDDADSWCCCEPLNNTERLLGWLTCFLGGLILSAISMGKLFAWLLYPGSRNSRFLGHTGAFNTLAYDRGRDAVARADESLTE